MDFDGEEQGEYVETPTWLVWLGGGVISLAFVDCVLHIIQWFTR